MKIAKFLAIAALLGLASYDSVPQVQAIQLEQAAHMRDFNGADEDEIMDKVFSKYSSEGKDHNGVKNGIKILLKSTAPKAAGVILEATHKLKGTQVPGYIKANFDKAWDRFDINADGFIKAEETHTFMRSLMGKLNKFALAPGSLSDIGAAAPAVSAPSAEAQSLAEDTPKPKPAPPVEETAPADATPDAAAADQTQEAQDTAALESAAGDATAVELEQVAGEILP